MSDRCLRSLVILLSALAGACGSSSSGGGPDAAGTDGASIGLDGSAFNTGDLATASDEGVSTIDGDQTPAPDAPPADDPRPFVGSWSYTSGTMTLSCPSAGGRVCRC